MTTTHDAKTGITTTTANSAKKKTLAVKPGAPALPLAPAAPKPPTAPAAAPVTVAASTSTEPASAPETGAKKGAYYNAQRAKLGLGGFTALKLTRATARFERYARELRTTGHPDAVKIAELIDTTRGNIAQVCIDLRLLPTDLRAKGAASAGTAPLTPGARVAVREKAGKTYEGALTAQDMAALTVVDPNRGAFVSCKTGAGETVLIRRGHLVPLAAK